MQLPSIAQLAITGLLASSTVSGFQAPGQAARRAAGAIAAFAAPAIANPVSPLALRNDEEAEKHRKKHHRHHGHHHERRQWGWGPWGGDDDDDDDDEPAPTFTPPQPGKTKGKKGKTTGGIRSTIIAPTGATPKATEAPTAPPAPKTTLKSKGRPTLPFPHKSIPHETVTPAAPPAETPLKHKAPTHTVTITLKAKSTTIQPTAVAEPTVTVTVIEPRVTVTVFESALSKSKAVPHPTPFYPPFGGFGDGDDDN